MNLSRVRILLFAVAIGVIPAAAQPGVYQANTHTLFYLPMDGPSPIVPEGCSVVGGPALTLITDRFGNAQSAIHVSGTGSAGDFFRIQCTNTKIAASASPSLTVGYWIRMTQVPTLGGPRNLTILATNSDNGGCRKYMVTQIQNGGYPLGCQGGTNGNTGEFTSSTSIVDSNWHQLIWVFDHINKVLTLYIDGVQNGSPAPLLDPSFNPQNTQFIAGAENGSFALNGDLDDFWIEDHAWSLAEIQNLTGVGQATLLHRYTFQGDANDAVGSANGTLLGGAVASGGNLTLNGSGQYVQFVGHLVPTSGSYSVTLFAQAVTPIGIAELISQGFSTGPGFYLGYFTPSSTRVIRATDSWQLTGVPFPTDGQQHHYALVVDAAANQSRLYLDGVLMATFPSAITTTTGGNDTRLGRQFDPDAEYFHGTLSDVRIYSGALDGQTVVTLAGATGASLGQSGPSTNSFGWTYEPINTATGNYFLSRTDLAVPGKGLGFAFTRAYNSLDSYSGPLGSGWTHSFNISLTTNLGSGVVAVKEADGHQDTFAPSGGGTYTPGIPGLFDSLIGNTDGSFTLTRKNQTQLNFSQTGKLTSIVDRNGNTQSLTYDGSGNMTSVTDSSGRSFTFAYDGNRRITSISDPISRSWQYSYGANGNLISVRDAAGGTTQYAYDANHRMSSAVDPRGITFLQNTFDSLGRVATQTNARGFVTTLAYNSPVAGTTTFTDPLGNGTKHVYDSALRLIGVVDAKGGTVSYIYDGNNDRTSITNQNGNTVNLTYDVQGNALSISDPLGNSQAFTYDSKNDLLTSTSPKGTSTTFTYDSKGNLLSIHDAASSTTSLVYNSAGLLTSKTDARGKTTSYAYDSAGDLTGVTDPLSNTTTLSYDGVGRLLTATDPNGHSASVAYDALNRIVKTTDPLSNSTQFAYDSIGNLLKITDANGKATNYTYDPTNNLTAVTDTLGQVTAYGYDANNNRLSFTNAKGSQTTYAFDPLNRLANITNPLNFTTSYGYDAVGNTVSTTDANGKTNQYAYDALNRLMKGSYADGSSASYAYDKDGNRVSMVDSRGTTTYAYDALDRVLSIASPGGSLVQYGYDAVGNRASLTYPDGRAVQYQYDSLNRLGQVADWSGKITHYTYDPASNLVEFTYPNGASSSYSYDAANRLLQIANRSGAQVLSSFTYSLDNVGNRLQVSSAASGVTKYGYDPLYRLTSWMVPSGQVTQYNYDAVGNRLSMVSSAGTTAYSYDAADRMLSAGTSSYSYDNNGNQIAKTTGPTTVNYTYDTLNRMTAASGGGINSQYHYDGDGNRVSQTVPAGTYQYLNDTATSLPVVLTEAGPDGNIDYLYGLSMISETSAAFQYFYQSDGLGSAASLTDAAGALRATYSYDPWGKLLVPIDPLGTKNKYKFTGEALDPGLGLYHFRARNYDPTVGRFVVPDPTMSGVNSYAYVGGNPLAFTDHYGLSGTLTIYSMSTSNSLGHSWISYTPDNGPQSGKTTTWATYGNDPQGPGSNGVNYNLELNFTCNFTNQCASRATYLTNAEQAQLYSSIAAYVTEGASAWTLWAPCSAFAAASWQAATGETLNTHIGPISDPLALKTSIIIANSGNLAGILQQQTQSSGAANMTASSK